MLKRGKETYLSLIVIVAMLTWGGSWVSAKAISADIPSEIVIFWRFFMTFISFIPIVIILKPVIRINRKGIIQVILGASLLVIYNLLFINGVRLGLAGEGGVIVTTLNPLLTYLITSILYKQKINKKEICGLLIGLAGGLILFRVWEGSWSLGTVFLFFAAFTWAILSLDSQKSKETMSPITFSFYTYGIAAIFDFFIALPNGVFAMDRINIKSWLNIVYLSLFATTFGTTAYFIAASKLGANKASSFTFLVPSSAVFFSWLLLGERVEEVTVLGGVLALVAVYIINYRKVHEFK